MADRAGAGEVEMEWCVVRRAYPEEPWRGPMTERDARKWVGEDGLEAGFAVACRPVPKWEIVDA